MRISPVRFVQAVAAVLLLIAALVVAAWQHKSETPRHVKDLEKDHPYGFVNKQGEFVIKPQFAGADGFSEGMAAVMDHGCLRFIRKDGSPAFEKRFFMTTSPYSLEWRYGRYLGEQRRNCRFSEGLCPAPEVTPLGGKARWGYVNNLGDFVIKPTLKGAGPFRQGRALVESDSSERFFIDKDGKPVSEHLNFSYTRFGHLASRPWFDSGLAPVSYGCKWGYVNAAGVPVIKPRFEDAEPFSEGLAFVTEREGNIGPRRKFFIDATGQRAIAEDYGGAGYFSEGLAPVQIGDKWGFIDKKGKLVVPARYDEACEFHDGLACVKQLALYGCIDKTGKMVIEPKFQDHVHFAEGLAPTCISDPGTLAREFY